MGKLEEILDELETRISPEEKIIEPIFGPKFSQLWQQARQLTQSQQPQPHNSQLQARLELALHAYDYITFEKPSLNLALKWLNSRERTFEDFWQAFEASEKLSLRQMTRNRYSQLVIRYREAQAPRIIEELGGFIQQRSERQAPAISNQETFNKGFLLLYDFYHRFFPADMRAIYPLEDTASRKSRVDDWREKNPDRLAYTAFIKIIEYFTRFCRTDCKTEDNNERNYFYKKVELILGHYAKPLPLTIHQRLAHIQKWMHDNINAKGKEAEALQDVVKNLPTPEQTYLKPEYNKR